MRQIKIGFLTSSDPRINASARFRVFQFLPYFDNQPTLKVVGVSVINSSLKPYAAIANILKALYLAISGDILFIQKARLPRPLCWLLTLLTRVIYDFDDSTFLPPPSWPSNKSFDSRRNRLNYCLQRSHHVIAGNDFLGTYARQHNQNVTVIPTVVTSDHSQLPEAYRWNIPPQVYTVRPRKPGNQLVIGWIGGGEHVRQLDRALAALVALQSEFDIKVKVVSDQKWSPTGLVVENKPWLLEDEVTDVQSFDIGLMPLDPCDPFLQGKCAFKAIEYMAVGSPVVASAVGANIQTVAHRKTGFLVSEPNEWEEYIRQLVIDSKLRTNLGREARAWVESNFSVESVLPIYLDLFAATAQRAMKKVNDQNLLL